MNQTDRNNINFLLYSSPQTLREWFDTTTPAEHEYARDIMNRYSWELTQRSNELMIEDQLRQMDQFPHVDIILDNIFKGQ